MARNINGGTDRIGWRVAPGAGGVQGCAFRFRTTQTTANVQLAGYWNNASRNGYGLILNNPSSGRVLVAGYDNANPRLTLSGTTVTNDGNWHSVVYSGDATNGGANALYIDGALDGTAASTGQWGAVTNNDFVFGDSLDTFWPSFIGDIADFDEQRVQRGYLALTRRSPDGRPIPSTLPWSSAQGADP